MKIELTVNGLKIQAQYQNEEIENEGISVLRQGEKTVGQTKKA